MAETPDALVIIKSGVPGVRAHRLGRTRAAPFPVLVDLAVPERDRLPTCEVLEVDWIRNGARGRVAIIEAVAECGPVAMEHGLHTDRRTALQVADSRARGEGSWDIGHAGEVVQRVRQVELDNRGWRFCRLEQELVVVGE